MAAEHAQARGHLVALGGHHAALPGGDDLVAEEAEDAHVAEAAGGAAAVQGSVRLGGVFEHEEAMPARDGADGVHIGGVAVEVRRDDAAGLRGDERLDGARVEVHGARLDVGQDGPRAAIPHDVAAGDEGEGGDDHLVAWLHSQGEQRQVQGGGAVAAGYGMFNRAEGGEAVLESPDEFARGREPRLIQAFVNVFLFVPGQHRVRDGYELVPEQGFLSGYTAGAMGFHRTLPRRHGAKSRI